MTTLTVLMFPSAGGAQKVEGRLFDLQKQNAIDVQAAAIVTWPKGANKPKTAQLQSLIGSDALSDNFWVMLFALLFFVPSPGLDIGGANWALAGKFSDCGIDDNFITQTRDKVTEGTSALFLLTTGPVLDKVVVALKGQSFEIISTNLPKAKEDELRAAFGAV